MSGEPAWVRSGPSSINFSNIVTIELLCGIFGLYFCVFVKEKLPYYYDEDKIGAYSHGLFRINLPGVHFNNSNWPHIVRGARAWCLITAVVFPIICMIFRSLFADVWGNIFIIVLIVALLGGLFIPMYVVARKYE